MDDRRRLLVPRADVAEELLNLLSDPFAQKLQEGTLYSALATSLAFTAIIAVLFSALRPYNQVVYAPKLKHADDKHAPPPVGSGYFSWIKPLWSTKEDMLIQYIGMDATLFLRFTRMCRNIFLALTCLYCAILIPVNFTKSTDADDDTWVDRITPLKVWGENTWSLVVLAWAANLIICGILFWNYRKVVGLRRLYFQSEDYRRSLHSRTLMVTDIPKQHCNDEGVAAIIDQVAPNASFARTTIARNVKHLPALITEYEDAVRELEKILAKYLKDPENLPAARPICSPPKSDPDFAGGEKVDAIDYWNRRVSRLRIQIVEARKTVDKRNAYPYGFASFPDIDEAHAVAHAGRKKHPAGSSIRLAPRPTDIIWENMHLDGSARRIRRLIVTAWIVLLTVLWIGPNAMLAIFLVNLSNLAKVWPAFATELNRNPEFWSIFQGVAAPAITSGFYLLLPIIFRRLQVRAGDQTKTGRERHVMSKLFSFFVFNNLVVFSLFSTLWSFVASVISDANDGDDIWNSIIRQELAQSVFISLCRISLFWVTWLLQRQLGAAIDLSQLWKLLYGTIKRRLSHPTPRELIELTAPPHFEYAMYYNYFLFYSTVSLTFSGLQPLVLPAAALYFSLDVCLKKYLLMYIFVTKNESGGLFWRPLFNRFVFAAILSNLVVFLAVWARGDWANHLQAYAVVPLPFLMLGFKILCSKLYDDKIYYYSQNLGAARRKPQDGMSRNDKLSARFGHPVLYKKLFKPMVHKKAQYKLSEVLHTRIDDDQGAYAGYSDSVVKMENMMADTPGKSEDSGTLRDFELVAESNLDFENYKNRAEFADEHGGGEIFARPGTPSSMFTSEFGSRPGTPVGGSPSGRANSPTSGGAHSYSPSRGVAGPSGYAPYSSALGSQSGFAPAPLDRGRSPLYAMHNDSQGSLVRNAASMAAPSSRTSSPARAPVAPGAFGALGGGPGGYGPVPQADVTPDQDPSSYDYFRAPRPRKGV